MHVFWFDLLNFCKLYMSTPDLVKSVSEVALITILLPSILSTINKKRFVVEMPMSIAKIQSTITDLLPLPPILTRDQCEILSEADNIVSNNHLTLKDLDIDPTDVEEEMKKWLWRYKDGGQFAKA